MNNKEISAKIKSLCKKKGITVKYMTEQLNISRNLIYDLEKKDQYLKSNTLEKIAVFFGVSMDYIAGRTDKSDINK